MKIKILIILLYLSTSAFAGDGEIVISKEECKFPRNSTADMFKSSLDLKNDPLPMLNKETINSPRFTEAQRKVMLNNKTMVYKFEQQGVSVFFNQFGKLSSVRFDLPYEGAIDGVKLGDSVERLIKIKGQPKNVRSSMYYYNHSVSESYLNFLVLNKTVHAIFSNGCSV